MTATEHLLDEVLAGLSPHLPATVAVARAGSDAELTIGPGPSYVIEFSDIARTDRGGAGVRDALLNLLSEVQDHLAMTSALPWPAASGVMPLPTVRLSGHTAELSYDAENEIVLKIGSVRIPRELLQ